MPDNPTNGNDYWQNVYTDQVAWEKRQKDLFAIATGISHHRLLERNHWSIVVAQREKIASLKRQMREMHNGYRRKIKRLEAEVAAMRDKLTEKRDAKVP